MLDIPHVLGFFKQLKEEGNMQFDDIDKEFLKYIQLNKTKLKYMMIKKFKDGLRDLKTILKKRDN